MSCSLRAGFSMISSGPLPQKTSLSKFSPCFPLATRKYGCTEVWVYPAECGEQLRRDPSNIGSSKSLFLKGFSGEGTLWDSPRPVSLALWDAPALFAAPLPLPCFPLAAGTSRKPRVETSHFHLNFRCGECALNSVQTRCIVKGEAQESPLFWRFSGGF